MASQHQGQPALASDVRICETAHRVGKERKKRLLLGVTVGFDDIEGGAFDSPALTTVWQPFLEIGLMAAEAVVRRITLPGTDSQLARITVGPEAVVRAATTPARVQLRH